MTGAGKGTPGAGGGGGLGLQTNCTAFWDFANTSWLDATGNGTTLTGTNSPTVGSGPGSNSAVNFNATGQLLSAASNSFISTAGGNFSVQCWANVAAQTGAMLIFNKDNNTFANTDWGFGTKFTTGGFWLAQVSSNGPTIFDCVAAAGFVANTWTHLVFTVNASTRAVVFYVNGSVSGPGNTLDSIPNASTAPLTIRGDAGTASTINMLVALCGFWKGRILSAGDVSLLYNSGSGLSFAAML